MTQISEKPGYSHSALAWLRHPIARLRAVSGRRKRSAQLVDHARALNDPAHDAALAGLWAFFRLVPSSRSSDLGLAAERFDRRTSREPALAQLMDMTEERMRDLDQGHAERHFLEISGYAEEDLPPVHASSARRAVNPGTKKPDRKPRSRRVRPGMLATLMVLFVVALASRSTDPLSPSLTTLSEAQPLLFGSLGETVRGHGEPLEDEASAALFDALEHIESARTSLLGFHTGYERAQLSEASRSLDRALETSISEPALLSAVQDLKDHIDRMISVP